MNVADNAYDAKIGEEKKNKNYLTTLCVHTRTQLAAYPVRLRPPRVGTHAGPRVRPPASLLRLSLRPPETALSAFLLEARGPRWRSATLPTHRATQESSNDFLARGKKHLHLLRAVTFLPASHRNLAGPCLDTFLQQFHRIFDYPFSKDIFYNFVTNKLYAFE